MCGRAGWGVCRRAERAAVARCAQVANVREFFRNNPQALVLLIITVVFGVGAFVAVIIALATAGSSTTDGEPSDAIWMLHAALPLIRL